MHQEKCNLTWHNHSDYLRGMLQSMFKINYQTDVTLVCDNKKYYEAHKIVLSAFSPVMKDIIDNYGQEKKPIIYLKGIQHQEIESLLEFIYLGEATFYLGRINEFLDVAKHFEFEEICKIIGKADNVDFLVEPNSFPTYDINKKEDPVETLMRLREEISNILEKEEYTEL